MNKPPGIDTGDATISVLSVSPIAEDHQSLKRLLRCPKWTVHKASKLSSAMTRLELSRVPLVVCERDLRPGTWKELLEHLTQLPHSPYLIVTALHADDYLWAEALNIGAYDVLAKPFDPREVHRILSLAWLHWQERNRTHSATNA